MKFEENEDQKVLLAWIISGLKINRDSSNLRGDAGYLLNNMIAKYTLFASEYRISIKAEEYMREEHQFDPENFYKRRAFYGKSKGVIYEHPIPATVVRKKLFDLKKPTEASVREILQKSGKVTVLLREGEDDDLRAAGLSSQMPLEWEWELDKQDARYEEVGIDISTVALKVDGAVCR